MPIAFLLIEELTRNPVLYFSWVFAVVLSIVLHELGHGFAALWQGDDTPRITGHITLDPMVHMGGFSLVLLFVVGIAFGAMPVNPARFRSKYGDAFVSFAGPAVNLVLAFLGLTIFALWTRVSGYAETGALHNFQQFFYLLGALNLVLFAFNLLPIPPLDGSTVLANFSRGFRDFIRNPNNQPFLMGGFILVFFFAGDLFAWAYEAAGYYIRLFHG